MAILRAFAFRVQEHIMERAFKKLPYVFPGSHMPSWKIILSRVKFLSGLEPVLYDHCPDSCVCYVGPYADMDSCPYCKEPRHDQHGRSCATFAYLPLIPRLKAFVANRNMATKMQYRCMEHNHKPGKIKDMFDGKKFRELCCQKVIIGGKELKHKHFKDRHDIALGLSTDGFSLFKRCGKKSAWPLIIFNYNLSPDIRFHRENIISLGLIPRKPRDFDSYLWPLVEELLRLEAGVVAYDVLTEDHFLLRSFLVLVFGDIPAVSMLMQMKGHNGYSPCQMCKITGVQVPDVNPSPYYVPLD
jgi:hypothetical protein